MMKIAIIYFTREGQTQRIAEHLFRTLSHDFSCDLFSATLADRIDWQQYDGAIIGASIHYGHFDRRFHQFVQKYREQLVRMSAAFYAVNLVARKAEKNKPETNPYMQKFLRTSVWQPDLCAVFAGALRYPHYGWLDKTMIRLIMKMTGGETDTTKEYEFTDWQQVDHFACQYRQFLLSAVRQEAIKASIG